MSYACGRRLPSTTSSSGSGTDLSQSSCALSPAASPLALARDHGGGPRCQTKPCVQFHPYTGRNVRLAEGGTLAVRQRSFAGLAFGCRPLGAAEVFTVQVEAVEPGWSGSLRVGLTSLDPDASPPLPAHSIPDLTDAGRAWMTSVTSSGDACGHAQCGWAQPRPFGADEVPIGAVGCTVAVFYTLDASSTNSEDHDEDMTNFTVWINVNNQRTSCIRARSYRNFANLRLFPLFDIFGETKAIRALTPYRSPVRLKTLCRDAIVRSLANCEHGGEPQQSPLGLPHALQQFVLVDHGLMAGL